MAWGPRGNDRGRTGHPPGHRGPTLTLKSQAERHLEQVGTCSCPGPQSCRVAVGTQPATRRGCWQGPVRPWQRVVGGDMRIPPPPSVPGEAVLQGAQQGWECCSPARPGSFPAALAAVAAPDGPHPLPPGCPVAPKPPGCLCPAPTPGIAAVGRRRGRCGHLLFASLSRRPGRTARVVAARSSTGVGGLLVAALTGVSVHTGASRLGLPGRNLVTRQCLGHPEPASAWAHGQGRPCGDRCGTHSPPRRCCRESPSGPGRPGRLRPLRPLGPHRIGGAGPLASLGSLPKQAQTPTFLLLPFVGAAFRGLLHAPLFPDLP